VIRVCETHAKDDKRAPFELPGARSLSPSRMSAADRERDDCRSSLASVCGEDQRTLAIAVSGLSALDICAALAYLGCALLPKRIL